jgi:hypothetical protein
VFVKITYWEDTLESQANKIKNEFSQFIQKSRNELENDNKTENLNKIKLSIQNYNKYHFEVSSQ